MRLRDLPAVAALLLALGAFAGFAWLTHHPGSPVVDWALENRFLSGWARLFRATYPLPPAAAVEVEVAEAPPEELVYLGPGGSATSMPHREWTGVQPYVWVIPGARLRTAPDAGAETVVVIDVIANLPVLESAGDWHRVVHRSRDGWVHVPDEGDEPPFGNDPEPPGPLQPRHPDPAKLDQARGLLGGVERVAALGPYTLHTDVADDALLARLDRAAAEVETAYRERYGLVPLGTPQEAFLLYAREEDYRRLQATTPRLVGLTAAGHNAYGIAASFLGERSHDDLAATVVHELVHLVNRRALGPALPPWLDEGICDDLAGGRIAPDGTLDPRALGGKATRTGARIDYEGALASLHHLQDTLRAGELPRLEKVLALDWDAFVHEGRSRLLYNAASFFVRYLLDGEGARRAPAFRAFLAAVAKGTPPDADHLTDHLGVPLLVVEAGFRGYVELTVLPVPAAVGSEG